MLDAYRFLVTAAPDALEAALEELRFKPHHTVWEEVAPGVALLEIEQPLAEWCACIDERPPVFVRHISPVQRELVLEGSDADLERLTRVAQSLAAELTPGRPFAIQTRLLDNDVTHLSRFVVNEQLAAAVQAVTNAPLNVREPSEVVSVALTPARAYVGVSPVSFNRSSWAGGAQRFAREQGQISRAEFKLLEAQAVFDFDWPTFGQALDLGAAPGGWTRILRRVGLPVVAVDPAKLDPRIARDRGVRHLQIVAQRFLPTSERFSVIVNDIRMDARDSAWLMVEAAPALEPDGLAVVTLKLPQAHMARVAYHALSILRGAYHVVGARQLFHNRSEVTAVLTPRAQIEAEVRDRAVQQRRRYRPAPTSE